MPVQNSDAAINSLRKAQDLKEVVAEQALEWRLLKKALSGMGETKHEHLLSLHLGPAWVRL